MAGATTTTLTTAIQKTFQTMVETYDYAETPLRNMLRIVPSPSGNAVDWKIHYGLNTTSANFSEGDAVSAAGNNTFADATISNTAGYMRTMVQYTGHAVDALKGGYFDGIMKETEGAIKAHMHAKEDLLVTAIEAAIDSGGSYAGLLRATYLLAAYENAVGTTALTDYQTMWTTLSKLEIGADLSSHIFACNHTMIQEYLDVAAGVQFLEYGQIQGGVIDAGKLTRLPQYNGRPFIDVPTLTDGTVLFFNPADFWITEFRPIQIDQMGKTDDSSVFSITSAETLAGTKIRTMGKLT
jgi:hypothetical protein